MKYAFPAFRLMEYAEKVTSCVVCFVFLTLDPREGGGGGGGGSSLLVDCSRYQLEKKKPVSCVISWGNFSNLCCTARPDVKNRN